VLNKLSLCSFCSLCERKLYPVQEAFASSALTRVSEPGSNFWFQEVCCHLCSSCCQFWPNCWKPWN